MNFLSTVVLGSIAGFTVYLGLPVARIKTMPRSWQAFLNAAAVGILVFLLFDMIKKALEPVSAALDTAKSGTLGNLPLLLILFAGGLGLGLLSLVYFDRLVIKKKTKGSHGAEATPAQLALMIAAGIGLHNFSEGLAIGQASRSGAVTLALLLIVGFGLHNATEGFGVAAPMASANADAPAGTRPSWLFLALLGLIAGGPTFLGTVLGFNIYSEPVFVLCLALAAGSILYVISELLHVGRRIGRQDLAMWGIFLGFLVAFGTDLLLTWGGA